MQEYLTKHNLKTKEEIAQHITELKRNTIPNLELISSLSYYLFDGENKIRANFYKCIDNNTPVIWVNKEFNSLQEAKEYFKNSEWEKAFYYDESEFILEKEEKSKITTENKGVLTDHVKEILKYAGTKDHGEVKPNSTRHKASTHCGGYKKPIFERKSKCSDQCFCDGSCKEPFSIKVPKPSIFNQSNFFDRSILESKPFPGSSKEEVSEKVFTEDTILGKKEAYKETEGKLFYELDWSFITQMAERMSSNKKEDKYDLFNWKRPMTPKGIEDLKQATLRHLIEVLDGKYEDDGREFGHIEAISDNMMMLNYQLKLNKS